MAFQKVKRMLGISAVVICCGTVLFVSGCEKKAEAPAVEQTIVVEDTTEDRERGAIANDIDLVGEAADAQTEHEITVFYTQCATEGDTLKVKTGEQAPYTVKDYIASNYLAYMQSLGYKYTYDEGNKAVYIDDRLVSDNVEVEEHEDGTKTLFVKDYKQQNSIPVVKYLRTAEHEVRPVYIGFAPLESNLVSGITFVLEQDTDDTFTLTHLQGVYDESLDGLRVYEGKFTGWSLSEDATEPVFDAGDEIFISDDMQLIPFFEDNMAGTKATATGEFADGELERIDDKVVVRTIRNQANGYALSGVDANKDTVQDADGQAISKDTVSAKQEGKSVADILAPTLNQPTNNEKTKTEKVVKTEQPQQQVVPQPTPIAQQPAPIIESNDDWGDGWGDIPLGNAGETFGEGVGSEYAGISVE